MRRTTCAVAVIVVVMIAQAYSADKPGPITIITSGKVSIQKGPDGKNNISIDFETSHGSKPKTYKSSEPYTLNTVGAVRETKTKEGLQLEVLSVKQFQAKFPKLSQGKGKSENPCGFMNNGGFKFCFDPECPHMPPSWHCVLHAAGNYCACEQKKAQQ